ncbi:MAG: DUF4494 domain-containing protein [Promethearchaeota archaeon]
MNKWFLVTVTYVKEFTDGTLKRISENYLLNANSFTDAEAKIYKEVGEFTRGEFLVKGIKCKNFGDIFKYDDANEYWIVKLSYVTQDADSGKERRIANHYLIEAKNITEATTRILDQMKGLMVTYKINSIAESGIVEIFETEGHQDKLELNEEE